MKTFIILSLCVGAVLMEPTIRPWQPFNAEHDAKALKDAMEGYGADTKKIADILGTRNNIQRVQIATKYKSSYGKDLVDKLKDELTGHFEELAVASIRPIDEFLAKELHDAMAGPGTDEKIIIEILCAYNNAWIRKINQAYFARYNRKLEDDIKDDTSGLFRKIMVSLAQAQRDESTNVNIAQARADAQALYDAGASNIAKDESTFNRILTQRSYLHLRKVFEHYETLAGKSFEEAVKEQFSGDSKDALKALVRIMTDSAYYFAKQLHKAMEGLGTTDKTLIRIIVTGSEFDHLAAAKKSYKSHYSKTLQAAIEEETSGDYKDMLIKLMGPN